MPGIPTEAVKAQPCSGHDGLTQQAGVTAPVEQMRNYAVATVPLTTPGDRWASGKLQGMPRVPVLGPCRGFLCLWVGTEPTAALEQRHTVAGQLGLWQDRISTPGSHSSRLLWYVATSL